MDKTIQVLKRIGRAIVSPNKKSRTAKPFVIFFF